MNWRALVLSDDRWHPSKTVRRGLDSLTNSLFQFEFAGSDLSECFEKLDAFAVVIVAKANHRTATDDAPWLDADKETKLRQFVRTGGGVFFIHGGSCYRDIPSVRSMAGGALLQHPEQCPVTVEPAASHSIVEGVGAFTEQDEHYIMAVDATDADVFLQSRSEHGIQAAGWVRTEGAGRVCVLTPGHNETVWLNSEFQKLLRNGLAWLVGPN